jgi:hypothetical protein
VKLHKTASTAQFPDDFQSPVLQTNLLSEREGEIDVQWYEIEHNEDVTKWNDFFWYSYFLLMLLLKVYNKLTFQSKFSPCIVEINFWLKKP